MLQVPVIDSIFIVTKAATMNLTGDLFALCVICSIILAFGFSVSVFYSMKFLNLEVPNEEVSWSHNQTGGIYLKLLLKICLCSQELYRDKLDALVTQIACMGFILGFEMLILVYRMNTPNIFNTLIHSATVFMEALILSLTILGAAAMVTGRDILTTLAYLFIVIPITIKIFFSVD